MKRLTWIYISTVSFIAILLAASTFPVGAPLFDHWKAFFVLITLSMFLQVVSSALPNQQVPIPHMLLFFTGVLLLPPSLIIIFIILIAVVDWQQNRREGNPIVRDRYYFPLRMGTHLVAALSSYWAIQLMMSGPISILGMGQVATIVVAALVYAFFHQVVGRGHSLTQGLDLQESGILDLDGLFMKVAMLFIGYGIAILWLASPWLLLIGLIPGLYFYQVHIIPNLKKEAYTDAKTGLSNMRHFDELFNAELTRASRMNQPLSVIMVDVDDLGVINNTYGHLAGDGALQAVSGTIRHQINANDIAARLGGEEFAIVLPEVGIDVGMELAESLRSQIEMARFEAPNYEESLQTTVSIGVATFPQHGITTLELIHAADVAMYQAKICGKNRVISAESVSNIVNQEAGHRESTEVLNYRAAFAPAQDSTSEGAGHLAAQHQEASHPETSEPSGTNGYRLAMPSPVAHSNLPGSDASHRVAQHAQNGASDRYRLPNIQTHSFSPDAKSLPTQPSVDKDSSGAQPSGLASSAVTKYQSELQNGPPSTNVTSRIIGSPRASKSNLGIGHIPPALVASTFTLSIVAVWIGLFSVDLSIHVLSLLVFGVVALVVQFLQLSMYESSTISVSAAIILAGTLVEGMPGLLTTCTTVVVVHSLQYRPMLSKIIFNWSTHILAGLAPFTVYWMSQRSGSDALPTLIFFTLISAIAYYGIESAFIASVIGIAKKQSILSVWSSQFRWLAIHYVVAGFVALSMSLSFLALGPWGVVAFAMPILLIYFAQKQYVFQTEESTKQLNQMNVKLSKANSDITTANQAFHRLTDELFLMLSKIIDARDPDVHGHASQVANYAEAIAYEMGLRLDEIEQIRRGALLHDIGKLGIPESILHKPGPLSDSEYEVMKRHPTLGADLLETCQSLQPLIPYVRYHHEWWNGKGYPTALFQDQIPLGARILAVCDAVEAMTSDRPYRKRLSKEQLLSELEKGSGTQFDPLVVSAFIKVLAIEGSGILRNSAVSAVKAQQIVQVGQ